MITPSRVKALQMHTYGSKFPASASPFRTGASHEEQSEAPQAN